MLDWPAVHTFHQLKTFSRLRNAKFLSVVIRQEWNNNLAPQQLDVEKQLLKKMWRYTVVKMASSQLFLEVLLPSNLRWDNAFNEIVKCLNIWYVFFVLMWIKYCFLGFANHCILFWILTLPKQLCSPNTKERWETGHQFSICNGNINSPVDNSDSDSITVYIELITNNSEKS